MRRIHAFLVVSVLLAPQGQRGAESPEQVVAAAPKAVATITAADLEEHAKTLSADDFEGRMTGTPGQIKTARYFADHFKKLGLKPLGDKKGGRRTYFQAWPIEMRGFDEKKSGLFQGSRKLTRWGALFLPRALRRKKRVAIKGRLVFAGRGEVEDTDLAGRIAVVQFAGAGQSGRGGGKRLLAKMRSLAQDARSAGARAAVLVAATLPVAFLSAVDYGAAYPGKPLVTFAGRGSRFQVDPPRLPTLVVAGADAQAVLKGVGLTAKTAYDEAYELAVGKKSRGSFTFAAAPFTRKADALNVCAYLPGTGSKRASQAVIFSCHMDHLGRAADGGVFNGADDNASGCATVLEIAEAFAALPKDRRPQRSVIFLAVSGEELGLYGSQWYVAHPTWPLAKVVADINMDMLGRSTAKIPSDTVALCPTHEHQAYSTLGRDAAFLGRALGLKMGDGNRFYRRSDHFNFAQKGVPVVFFSDDEHPDYHMPTDTADKLDYPKIEKIGRLAFLVGYRAAGAKARPKRLGRRPTWF